MPLDELTPPLDDKLLLTFCESICPGELPFYVPVVPDRSAIELRCFENVRTKVQREGGDIVFGWEIGWEPKVYLEAQFHSVWRSPSGTYVDVTPPPVLYPQGLQISRILFLKDIDRRDGPTIVPPRRAALGDAKLVERLWQLSDEMVEIQEQMEQAGSSSLAFERRTRSTRAELHSILARLKNSPQTMRSRDPVVGLFADFL